MFVCIFNGVCRSEDGGSFVFSMENLFACSFSAGLGSALIRSIFIFQYMSLSAVQEAGLCSQSKKLHFRLTSRLNCLL